ncbi:YaaA family protein [Lysobacter korlensis]|uniref:YaaA family protein n=1 Tax=Lysobacter korlensis TaxID=553636 RepID=A0ABV6S2Y0_9GAMM
MLLLLPPSETKRDGGDPARSLDLGALSFPTLTPPRRATLAALRRLSRNLQAATLGLKLGASQRFEVDRNRVLGSSPVLPAIERYTGVLYDGLDAQSLDPAERSFAAGSVAIASALFGLLRADDPIPAYRLSHDSRLPGLSLKTHWKGPVSAALAEVEGPLIDLRSEGYVALGPLPDRPDAVTVRVVTEDAGGQRKALNHFNKKAKGEFTRAVIRAGVRHGSVESLLEWAPSAGIRFVRSGDRTLDLIV